MACTQRDWEFWTTSVVSTDFLCTRTYDIVQKVWYNQAGSRPQPAIVVGYEGETLGVPSVYIFIETGMDGRNTTVQETRLSLRS